MAAAILYQYPLAFNPQKALFAIHDKGLANKVEMRYINLFNGQSLRPWYMKINPNSTVGIWDATSAGYRCMRLQVTTGKEFVHGAFGRLPGDHANA